MTYAHRTLLTLAAAALVLPGALAAQTRALRGPAREAGSSRGAVGGSFNYAVPTDDFRRYVRQGFGVDGFFRWNADPEGVLSLRIDGGFLVYGNERKRVPLSSTIGGRIQVDLTTSNNIVWMGIGPQVTLPYQYMQPYANAGIGFSYFFTQSSVEGSDFNNSPFASTRNFSDATFAWGVGGGFLIPLGATRASIDIGGRYHSNGVVQYLREGSIEDRPDGSIVLHPIRSRANLLAWRLGVSVAIP